MNSIQYCENQEVDKFSRWLGEIILGNKCIDFSFNQTQNWKTLSDCLQSYSWPTRANYGPNLKLQNCYFPDDAKFELKAGSTLAENDVLLTRLGAGLRNALNSGGDVEPWVLSVFQWGGMLAGGAGAANREWVSQNRTRLPEILKKGCEALCLDSDEVSLQNFRFNASMTKVYSLLLEDFVIYDSRVGAALSWLVLRCYKGGSIPEYLKFAIPPSKSVITLRNPRVGNDGFSVLRNDPLKYIKWNIRANWILTGALRHSKENPVLRKSGECQFKNIRRIEAALFTLGRDLTYAR